MSFTITVDNDLKLVKYNHSGVLSKEDIGMAWQELLKLKEFTELKYNLLTDYRDSTCKIEVEEVDLICVFLVTLKNILKDKKQALIIDEPLGVAISTLFEGEVNKKIGFIVRVFSSQEAATNWLY